MQSADISYTITSDPHPPDWIDVLIHPRSAFERILATRTLRSAIALGIVFVLAFTAAQLSSALTHLRPNPESFPTLRSDLIVQTGSTLTVAAVSLVLFVFACLVVGRFLYGSGDLREVTMALGWSSIPGTLCCVLLAADAVIAAEFVSAGDFAFGPLNWAFVVAAVALALYATVLSGIALSVAHRFSLVQALSTIFSITLFASNAVIVWTYFFS